MTLNDICFILLPKFLHQEKCNPFPPTVQRCVDKRILGGGRHSSHSSAIELKRIASLVVPVNFTTGMLR